MKLTGLPRVVFAHLVRQKLVLHRGEYVQVEWADVQVIRAAALAHPLLNGGQGLAEQAVVNGNGELLVLFRGLVGLVLVNVHWRLRLLLIVHPRAVPVKR